MTDQPTLAQYVRHAEHYGVECVYETAEQLGLPQLAMLVGHLRRIDKRWKLTSEQRFRLVDALLRNGVRQQVISDMIGVSLISVKRRSADLRAAEQETRMVDGQKGIKSEGHGS